MKYCEKLYNDGEIQEAAWQEKWKRTNKEHGIDGTTAEVVNPLEGACWKILLEEMCKKGLLKISTFT